MPVPLVDELKPLLNIVGAIMDTNSLIKNGIEPKLQSILLPSLFITYGGSIIANTISPTFSFSLSSFLTHMIGLTIAILFPNNAVLLFFIEEIPTFSSLLGLIGAVEDPAKDSDLFPASLVKTFASRFIKCVVLSQKMTLKTNEIVNIVAKNAGLYFIRRMKYNPLAALVLFLFLLLVDKICAEEDIKGERLEKSGTMGRAAANKQDAEEEESISDQSEHDNSHAASEAKVPRTRRRTRRKASVANAIEDDGANKTG